MVQSAAITMSLKLLLLEAALKLAEMTFVHAVVTRSTKSAALNRSPSCPSTFLDVKEAMRKALAQAVFRCHVGDFVLATAVQVFLLLTLAARQQLYATMRT
jgi:hypothetical protein